MEYSTRSGWCIDEILKLDQFEVRSFVSRKKRNCNSRLFYFIKRQPLLDEEEKQNILPKALIVRGGVNGQMVSERHFFQLSAIVIWKLIALLSACYVGKENNSLGAGGGLWNTKTTLNETEMFAVDTALSAATNLVIRGCVWLQLKKALSMETTSVWPKAIKLNSCFDVSLSQPLGTGSRENRMRKISFQIPKIQSQKWEFL